MAQTQIRSAQILDATVTEDDLAASVAGDGISGGAGSALALDINELTGATVDVAADSIAIVDANDSNTSRKELIADVISATAGDGLGASSGVLAVNVDDSTVEINADTVRVKAAGITNNELGLGSVDVDNLSDLRVTDAGGLDVSVAAGTIRDDNTITSVSAVPTLTLTDDATNFVEVNSSGTVSANTSSFTSGSIPLAQVTTVSGDITVLTDKRAWLLIDADATGLTESDFVDNETPSGDLDGVDTTYTLANAPSPTTSLKVYVNGIRQKEGGSNDYTLSGSTITFTFAPIATDVILADYRF